MAQFDLTPEEQFLWDCARWHSARWYSARHWRAPEQLASESRSDLSPTYWARVVAVGRHNKMPTLLHQALSGAGLLPQLPPAARADLDAAVALFQQRADGYAGALAPFLRAAADQGIEVVVLKGLALSIDIYGDPALRPGGDIDLLVRRQRVAECLEILESLGQYRWNQLRDDRYYDRHHLHQTRGRLDTRIWYEIHWALDHPYTLLTIDYEAMLDRASPGRLLDEPVRNLSLPDLLLSLVVHLVKHAVYLTSAAGRPDLPRIILADGMLMYYLDVAEVVGRFGPAIDWPATVDLAGEWGVAAALGAVLGVCHDYLGAAVPERVLAALPVTPPGRLRAALMNRMADHEVATYLGQKPGRLWSFLVGYNEAFILRPVRLLDAASYLWPPADYLSRRYGGASFTCRLGHFGIALGQYGRGAFDTLYYTWDYHHRLKRQDAVLRREMG